MNNFSVFDNYINGILKDNRAFSHAYLFSVNNYDSSLISIKKFVKVLLCPSNEIDSGVCSNVCNICHLIDENVYDDLVVLDGSIKNISKEEIALLQENFKDKSFSDYNRVYVIYGADKLNPSVANSLLKFIEEPFDKVFCLLVCQNYNNVLDTIRSRCIYFNLKEGVNSSFIDFNKNIDDFLIFLEKKKLETLAFVKELWFDKVVDKTSAVEFFDYMVLIYQTALEAKIDNKIVDSDVLSVIVNNNSVEDISLKLVVMCDIREKCKINMNSNLLLDNLIINFSKCVEE